MMRQLPAAAAALGLMLAVLATPAHGQVQELDRVEELAARGRVDRARSALTGWWERHFQGADPALRQQALWLRGRLTVDPGMASRDYLRLVVEHPGGPHSAAALLRLGQAEAAEGRAAAAADRFERLQRQYPESPERLEARRWLEEHRDEVRLARSRGSPAAPRPPPTEAEAGPPPSGADAFPRTDTEADGGSDAPGPRATEPGGELRPISVQLGAFSSRSRADGLLLRARSEGLEALRLVRVDGSELVRVRAGRFADPGAAAELRDRVRALGFDAVVVSDGNRERELR